MKTTELKAFLEEKYNQYNQIVFIESDPVSIPHLFSKKEDIEIAGFLAATISWGQRTTILKNAKEMMRLMDNAPHDFIRFASAKDFKAFEKFKHRTFNGVDLIYFLKSLQNIYTGHKGLEGAFKPSPDSKLDDACRSAMMQFRSVFFEIGNPGRTSKHVSNPAENSSSKRLCMYLRWMIRDDKRGVDFGIWKSGLKPSQLMCPLDVHTGNVGRKLGLLKRTQNDWKAVQELTASLKKMDATDPVKYDFSLFGLGVFEKF